MFLNRDCVIKSEIVFLAALPNKLASARESEGTSCRCSAVPQLVPAASLESAAFLKRDAAANVFNRGWICRDLQRRPPLPLGLLPKFPVDLTELLPTRGEPGHTRPRALLPPALCPFLSTHAIIASDLIVATTSSVKEAKFQPHAPLSHISLDAYPSVQVSVGWVGEGGYVQGKGPHTASQA